MLMNALLVPPIETEEETFREGFEEDFKLEHFQPMATNFKLPQFCSF